MAHPGQHLAGQRAVTHVLAQMHRLLQMPTAGIGVAHIIGHPPGQLVEFGHGRAQLAVYVAVVPALMQRKYSVNLFVAAVRLGR